MSEANKGDKVRVKYTGKLQDGTVFDSSEHHDGPLEFTIGGGYLIPGFEEAVVGMNPGESKTVEIDSEEAFGERSDEMLLKVPRDQFPEDLELELNQELQLQQQDGESAVVRVVEMEDDTVTLDANHPLAGENLTFEIELLEIL